LPVHSTGGVPEMRFLIEVSTWLIGVLPQHSDGSRNCCVHLVNWRHSDFDTVVHKIRPLHEICPIPFDRPANNSANISKPSAPNPGNPIKYYLMAH
jgi:hypothetical protein